MVITISRSVRSLRKRDDLLEWQAEFNSTNWRTDWPRYVKCKTESARLREKQMNSCEMFELFPYVMSGTIAIILFLLLGLIIRKPWIGGIGIFVSIIVIVAIRFFNLYRISQKRQKLNRYIELYEEKWNNDVEDTTLQDYYVKYKNRSVLPPEPDSMYKEESPAIVHPEEEYMPSRMKKSDFFEPLDFEDGVFEDIPFEEPSNNIDDYDYVYEDEELEEEECNEFIQGDGEIKIEPEVKNEEQYEVEAETEIESEVETEVKEQPETEGEFEVKEQDEVEEQPETEVFYDLHIGGNYAERLGNYDEPAPDLLLEEQKREELRATIENVFAEESTEEDEGSVGGEIPQDTTDDLVEVSAESDEIPNTEEVGSEVPRFNSFEEVRAYYSKFGLS